MNSHVSYDSYKYDLADVQNIINDHEYLWRKRLLENTPNGYLLTKNAFFDALKQDDSMYVAHITPNFHNIASQGVLYPSAGCLVGSLYAVPLTKEGDSFRMHNLGKFILNKEVPFLQESRDSNISTQILVAEVGLSKGHHPLLGVDYLRLGSVHFSTYKELEFLLSSEERLALEETCIRRIRSVSDFLKRSYKLFRNQAQFDSREYIQEFLNAIPQLSILGYFYFEVLSEYILLHQDSESARRVHEKGEFYAQNYKDLVYTLHSGLTKNFSLRTFAPPLGDVIKNIHDTKVIGDFNEQDFVNFVAQRLLFIINARLFSDHEEPMDWSTLRWTFLDLSRHMSPLIGHLLHRELRTFGRYPDFYFYFDQIKALRIWNFWNELGVRVPFNGLIPKGEVGVNPAHTKSEPKIYGSTIELQNDDVYLRLTEQLPIEVASRLVDPRFVSMREDHSRIQIL